MSMIPFSFKLWLNSLFKVRFVISSLLGHSYKKNLCLILVKSLTVDITFLIIPSPYSAVFVSEDGSEYVSMAPKGTVVNSVGAGDSMVAGFIAGYLQEGNTKDAFYQGVATGSASAFSEELATKEQMESLLKQIKGD